MENNNFINESNKPTNKKKSNNKIRKNKKNLSSS